MEAADMDGIPLTTLARVAHLSRRAGFGVPPAELEELAASGVQAAIDRYVDYESESHPFPADPPVLVDDPNVGDVTPLQRWWLNRMIRSPRQLEEKMTLFWHSLFATSNDKVDIPSFMYEQNMLFRRHALGDFGDLLSAVCVDPAMLVWLDGDGSSKEHPNENFARECMELFSIGVDHYTQRDVHEAARAYTGWSIDGHNRRVYDPSSHDPGVKSFLGYTGHFTYRDIACILSNHPQCGRFLGRKLWSFFAYEHPDDWIVEELARVYRENHRSMRSVVRHMFHMDAFWQTSSVSVRVKSPVEHAVTAVRELGARVHLQELNDYITSMGQTLFYPPNVGGWPMGPRWINSTTVVGRFGFAEWVLERHDNRKTDRVNWEALPAHYGAPNWRVVLHRIAQWHLLPEPSRTTTGALRRFIEHGAPGNDHLATLESVLQLALVSPEYYCA
ncbi:MAG: hypothetical protein NVSMB52_05580 [Chloroflexota bacterium]